MHKDTANYDRALTLLQNPELNEPPAVTAPCVIDDIIAELTRIRLEHGNVAVLKWDYGGSSVSPVPTRECLFYDASYDRGPQKGEHVVVFRN